MPYETAALTEPMAVAYHGINSGVRALAMPLTAARTDILGAGVIADIDWIEQRPLSAGAEAFRELHQKSVATAKIVRRS